MTDQSGRREFIGRLTSMAGAAVLGLGRAEAAPPPVTRPRAVVFDGLALFDPRPVAALAGQLVPERAGALVDLWRVKQFDYQWLRALAGRYQDFRESTEGALTFAARALGVDLPAATRDRLMQAWLQLKAWPDVAPGLRALRAANLRLAPLANLTPAMLQNAITNSGLEGLFDEVISTDRARTFKPDPRAYQLAVDVLRVTREEIVFVPSAGWDAAGARWFGFPTYWINRSGAPPEELDAETDGSGSGMDGLVRFVGRPVATTTRRAQE